MPVSRENQFKAMQHLSEAVHKLDSAREEITEALHLNKTQADGGAIFQALQKVVDSVEQLEDEIDVNLYPVETKRKKK